MPAHYDAETLAQHFAQISDRFGRIEAQLELISQKLGIPYERPGAGVSSDVVEQVRAGNQLEAIKLYRAHTGASFEDAQQAIAEI